jgi:hypothetical protein
VSLDHSLALGGLVELAWLSTRRMYLLPFAERLLEFSSALSSFPGQVPTQEVNSAAEENVLAVTPTRFDPGT